MFEKARRFAFALTCQMLFNVPGLACAVSESYFDRNMSRLNYVNNYVNWCADFRVER